MTIRQIFWLTALFLTAVFLFALSPVDPQQAHIDIIRIQDSIKGQAKGERPEHHEKRARFYGESKAWQVKEIHHLEAVRGNSAIGLSKTGISE